MEQFMTRIYNILLAEGVDLSSDDSVEQVQKYINASYPDFRKTLNVLQSSVVDGKLVKLEDSIENSAGYRTAIVEALKAGNIRQMREQIVQNILMMRWMHFSLTCTEMLKCSVLMKSH